MAEAIEETVGAYVPLNDDDDDYDALHKPDWEQSDPFILGENDLLPITLHKVEPVAAGGQYTLTIPAGIRVWKFADRSGEVTSGTQFSATSDKRLYVEGVQVGSTVLRINWSNGVKTINDADRLTIHVFDMTGPLNVPGYSIYEYFASGGHPDNSQWLDSPYFTTKEKMHDPITGLDYIDVLWDQPDPQSGERYFVGKVPYKANTGYVWQVDVNVVEVKLSQVQNTNTVNVVENGPTHVGDSVIAGTPQFTDTMVAKLDIERVRGPIVDGQMRGVKFMQMGFMQVATVSLRRALYIGTEVHEVHIDYQGESMIDARASSVLPWYDFTNAAFQGSPNVSDARSTMSLLLDQEYSAATSKQLHFAISDRPQLQATDRSAFNTGTEIIPASRYDVLIAFDLYFGVKTKERRIDAHGRASDELYTQRTAATWVFNGVGTVANASANSYGTWSSTAQNEGDPTNGEITSGAAVPYTTTTRINARPLNWIAT